MTVKPRWNFSLPTLDLTARFWSSETTVMMLFAVLVGIGAALGTFVFIKMIQFATALFFGQGSVALGFMGGAYVILVPVLGGLLVGPIVHFIAPEAKGHGVPEVLTAIATRGGRIRPVVVLAKALGSAITIGSGGSVGREGPIVQIGAALGSTLGQAFKMNERRVITLVAAGAASGIAATFNAPIAGVMFAVEVLLGEIAIQSFPTIVVAAVSASVVSRALLGDQPAFSVPPYELASPWELPMYLGLGVFCALAAILFVKVLYLFEDIFDDWKFPPYLKPAVGGLGLGVLGYFLPQVFGTGFDAISQTLAGNLGLTLLIILIFGKILATSLTLGSGSSGGVFAPALFVGAVLGGAYGQIMHSIFPQVTALSGAYAMVGMAAVFAGAARAPITAILILFEMTQDYHIILPLMFATVVSTVLAQHFEKESIYTLKLKQRGLDVRARRDANLMSAILVNDAMTPLEELTTVRETTTLAKLTAMFQESGHHGFIVLNDAGELFGVVTLSDLERALENHQADAPVGEICTRTVVTVFPDETLDDALRQFGALDVGRLPVVERRNPKRVLGMVRRADIVRAYAHAQQEKHSAQHNRERMQLEAAAETKMIHINLAASDAAAGKRIKELNLPENSVIVAVQRGGRTLVPRGNTQLQAGDRLVALADADVRAALFEILQGTREEE